MPILNRRRPHAQSGIRIIAVMVIASLLIGLAAAGLMLLLSSDAGYPLPPPAADLSWEDTLYLRANLRWNSDQLESASAHPEGIFEVSSGQSAFDVCANLAAQGWVSDGSLACDYLRYTGGDRSISSGLYWIPRGQSARQIASALAAGKNMILSLTVFPGWRTEEIAQAFPASRIPIPPGDFIAAAYLRPGNDLAPLYAEIPTAATLEGFLLPGTYRVLPGDNAIVLMERMVRTFEEQVPEEWRKAYKDRGLTLYQAVTLASIIQRETTVEDEMPTIASVYVNRLAAKMKLEADPTVQFAVGFDPARGGWWPFPLSEEDLLLNTPFNTYRYPGLPPNPIANPGLAALHAVAFPADTRFLFFRAACDGSGRHRFAETYAQHLANGCPAS
jgi:UPF0755 protein